MTISDDPIEAAIQFIDEMIPHHQMAIDMVGQFKSKVTNAELLLIMDNIQSSQKREIDDMKRIKGNLEEGKSLSSISEIKKTKFI